MNLPVVLFLLARFVQWRHIQFLSIADTSKSEINLNSLVIPAILIEKESICEKMSEK